MPLKVAVLQDDADLPNDILVPGLRALGFDAEGFVATKDLYRRMLAKTFDAMVLDISLPDKNGFEVASYLRTHSKLAIIALTGPRFSDADKAKLQADAWLTKPIDVELIAIVLSELHKRKRADNPAKSATNKWRLDPVDWKLHAHDGRSVTLGPSEHLLLGKLFASPGKVVARNELIVALADSAYDFDPHRLEMLVHRLRRKVSTTLNLSLPLHTVRGKGYTMLMSPEDPANS